MYSNILAVTLVGLVGCAVAQTAGFDPITKPKKNEIVQAGKSYEIIWRPSADYNGTITINLIGGKTRTTLSKISEITSGFDNSGGKYDWDVASDLGTDHVYGLNITYDADPDNTFQYSNPFKIHMNGNNNSSSSSTTHSHSATESSNSYSATITTTTSTSTSGSTLSLTSDVIACSGCSGSAASTSTSIPTAAAATVGVGSYAMFGGVAMAVFAV